MVVWTDYDEMARQVKNWLRSGSGNYLNAGELADSLAFGKYSRKMLDTVLPLIGNHPQKGLYLLTKSAGELLKDVQPLQNVVVGFSVNADEAGRLYEKDAPLPSERLNGAFNLKQKGWRIRVRLDPMLPIPDWERHYLDIIKQVNDLSPEKVTLGSLRFNRSLPAHCPPSDIWSYASEREAGNKKRIDHETTTKLYRFAVEHLKSPAKSVCKESPELWTALNIGKLNCVCI